MDEFKTAAADLGITVEHHFIGGVYCKQVSIPAGVVLLSHKHKFDHMSVLVCGSVDVTSNGNTRVYSAPSVLNIAADVNHTVRARDDSVWLCIHATDETDPDKVDDELIV